MNDIEARLEVLRPCAGDTIVISATHRLSRDQVEQIRSHVGAALPAGVKTLVLDSSLAITHVVGPPPALVPAPSQQVHFDTWYSKRIDVAHAKYIERTSYHLRCDWNMKAIINYLNGSGV